MKISILIPSLGALLPSPSPATDLLPDAGVTDAVLPKPACRSVVETPDLDQARRVTCDPHLRTFIRITPALGCRDS